MATASSVQREPSMEEILASIRRIIEDSDTGRKQPGHADDLRQDLDPPAPAERPAPEVDAFRAELRGSAEPRKPVTLAEVQAQLAAVEPVAARAEPHAAPAPEPRRAAVTLPETGSPPSAVARPAAAPEPVKTPTPGTSAGSTIVADWRREMAAAAAATVAAPPVNAAPASGAPQPGAVATAAPAVAPAVLAAVAPAEAAAVAPVVSPEVTVSEPEALDQAAPEIEIFEDELTDEALFLAGDAKDHAAPPSANDLPMARPAILSEHAGRQVAAAFGELSDAFASRSKKTFDEMAEEMLRPMLQDWLDNNLPTLVERLVREEIERVARGPH